MSRRGTVAAGQGPGTVGVPCFDRGLADERSTGAGLGRGRDDRAPDAAGCCGRDHLEGALVLQPCRWVHTIGMRFPLDVAFVDDGGPVVKVVRMERHRVGVAGARRRRG